MLFNNIFFVQIWDISSGECTHIFGGHCHAALSACWSSFPSLSNVVMSSGSDCCLRLWQVDRHTTDVYTGKKTSCFIQYIYILNIIFPYIYIYEFKEHRKQNEVVIFQIFHKNSMVLWEYSSPRHET